MIKATIRKRDLENLKKELKKYEAPIDKKTADKIGRAVVQRIKDLVKVGLSPVKGFPTRFPRYKNPDKYPGDRKNKSPVNLKLTGHMLKNLIFQTAKRGKNYFVSVGYLRDDFAADKESGHREGVNAQPKRPTIPQGKETFREAILVEIQEIIEERIENLD
jgi:hypothetical protein